MGKKSPEITIVRTPLERELGGYEYLLTAPHRPLGDARVYFFALAALQNQYSPLQEIYETLLQERILPEERIAGIVNFYPQGRGACQQYMRRGVGSQLLEKIIQDCQDHKVKALFLITHTPTMISFVEKKKFVYGAGSSMGKGYYLKFNNI